MPFPAIESAPFVHQAAEGPRNKNRQVAAVQQLGDFSKNGNGEGGIRTRGRRVNSYAGLANNYGESVSDETVDSYGDVPENWALDWARAVKAHPELGDLIRAWPDLPPHVREAINTLACGNY